MNGRHFACVLVADAPSCSLAMLARSRPRCARSPAAVEGPLPAGERVGLAVPSPTRAAGDAAVTLDVCSQVTAAAVDRQPGLQRPDGRDRAGRGPATTRRSMVTAAETIKTTSS